MIHCHLLKNLSLVGSIVFLLSGAACGSDGGSSTTEPPTSVVVEFVYEAATEVDPGVAQQFPQCVQGVGQTHIHPSWRNFVRIDMTADNADQWSITFTDVPVDSEQRIRISDPNACASDPNGASTEYVFANGTQLLRVVDTPGNGIEPGLAFIVSPSGEVFP